MNLYNYTLGDPLNSNDPKGLDSTPTCGGSTYLFDGVYQGTLSFIMGGISNQAIMAQTRYAESGHGPNVDSMDEETAIGEVIMNRWDFVNGDWHLFNSPVAAGSKPLSTAGWGTPGDSIYSIAENPSQFAVYQANANGTVSLTASAQKNITNALNSSATSSACSDLAWALTVSFGLWDNRSSGDLYVDNGLVLTSFNSFNPPHASDGYSQSAGGFGDGDTFYGLPESSVSDTLPPPTLRRGPGRGPGPIPAPPRPPRKPGSPQ